ncbi:MAG: 4Fe-4S dicluster domain-containing protein [Bacteroidia bacterium]|nr:4Fe-4S dicluster domain-containing protein [Bacteroidia bacterium]MBT8269853.1 4Fe-4S dicluster domain-containing protein [Bacteroidia bacterium]NNK69579.1 4Fe-4S dicluster domain-containing protein [Flavobacteriaceae bacterium]NNL80930.1 4Fe-4S dicluster domain-containing protein [Flavobacteriaceae bacterium]
MMKKDQSASRRRFLNKGLRAGIITVLGGIGLGKLTTKLIAANKHSDGNSVELMTTDGRLIAVDSSEVMDMPDHLSATSYNVREGMPNRKFVMVVDLAKCKNALNCQQSCNKHHYITGDNAWLKIYDMQESRDTAQYWMPMMCQHCDKPACVTVCPVDATFKRRDGLVLIDNERCIGCRFCMAACPYSTRVFNWGDPGQEVTLNMDLTDHHYSPEHAGLPSQMGTVDKCDFCPHQVDKGELPHCVTACPNGVFYYGDKYEDTVTNGDETLRLSKLLEDKSGYRFLEGLGTEPSVYYLPPVDRLVDFEDGMEYYKPYESVEKPE